MRTSPHIHAIHDEWLSVCSSLLLRSDSVCLSFSFLFSSHVDNAKANNPCASANRGILPLAEYTPPTKCSESDLHLGPMKDRDDYLSNDEIGQHPKRTRWSQHIHCQHTEDKAEKYATSQSAAKTGMAQWTLRRILLKTELIIFFFFLVVDAKLVARRSMARHSIRRSPMAWTTVEEVSRNSMELSNLSEKKLIMLLQVEQLRRDQLLLHDHFSKQNRDLREVHMESLNEMEELKRFQGSRFDEFSRIILI